MALVTVNPKITVAARETQPEASYGQKTLLLRHLGLRFLAAKMKKARLSFARLLRQSAQTLLGLGLKAWVPTLWTLREAFTAEDAEASRLDSVLALDSTSWILILNRIQAILESNRRAWWSRFAGLA